MGDHHPSTLLMPPPPSSLSNSNLPIFYYGLVVVGTAATVLVLYNLIILKWCTDFSTNRYSLQRATITTHGSSRRFQSLSLVSSFKYKKEVAAQDIRNHYECAVCLSVFEEGEELRQLQNCKHPFHAPCIDMWLYSHMNCPICRCTVEPPVVQRLAATEQSLLHSSQGLQSPGMLV